MAVADPPSSESERGNSNALVGHLNGSGNITSNGSSSLVFETQENPLSPVARTKQLDVDMQELFGESRAGKIWRTAAHLSPAGGFPEHVLPSGETAGKYISREATFWTCGFFPGSVYTLLERSVRFPQNFPISNPEIDRTNLHEQLLDLCQIWSEPLHSMALRRNTHDIGFIIMPALRLDWELTGNARSFKSILTAAESLASRYDERVGAIRSWDKQFSNRYSITDKEENFLVIIDSMCNLDLLYYAGHHTGNQRYINIATAHAHAVARAIIRPDGSSFHVCNFHPQTGAIQRQFTHQGYKDKSTWSRGQAWGILGFAQTYAWTKDPAILQAATALSDHFLKQLSSATHHHPYVPLWDFDDNEPSLLRDTSAGMIAANGLLILHQQLATERSPYLDAVRHIVKDTVDLSLATDLAPLKVNAASGKIEVAEPDWASILKNATANNNEFAIFRYSDHGLVYADYYFLELGNKLLRMGLV
ncbi:hypothetical protein VE00_08932 [Pseudogymnoascus sp. WSF 3629]|nr:hypothetical protein VE00_08932 [Pseudogymnoascus sp. WSF 3629]